MTHDRSLAEPAFPDDDGRVYPALASALGEPEQVLAVLGEVRVFVPIVATLGVQSRAAGPETLASGYKDADMAAVLRYRSGPRAQWLSDLQWALLNKLDFTFNY